MSDLMKISAFWTVVTVVLSISVVFAVIKSVKSIDFYGTFSHALMKKNITKSAKV